MQKIFIFLSEILKFWYREAPKNILNFFISLNKAFMGVFSLPLMLKTFFKPWKNEYREGLVGFSIFMGMTIKSLFILADFVLLVGLVIFEIAFFIGFLIWPFIIIILPFVKL
jgi:hypothetical protein